MSCLGVDMGVKGSLKGVGARGRAAVWQGLLASAMLCAPLVLTATVMPLPAYAQDTVTEEDQGPALLVADSVFVENESLLVASGNVEALQGDTRLTADTITYDRRNNTLKIEGPIRITDPENGVILLADAAELDEGFRNGLLTGARVVLDQQLQMAAVEARRVNGRYTQLSRVAVTSCQVCGKNETPLWQIRASRVIHDQEEQQIYFENAQFRLLDVPIAYIPRLRMPDPTLDRARGFLYPTFTSSTLLGFGVKVPYFIPIGDHQDVTLTPYLTTKSRSLEFRYRRAFQAGDLTLTGALSTDQFRDETLRGYLFANGRFTLPRDYKLTFALKSITDEAYLNDYDISSADRLASTVSIARIRQDRRISFGLTSYQTLRETEANATQPNIPLDIRTDRRFGFPSLPGEFRLSADLIGIYRDSDLDVDGTDDDKITDGRDVARVGVEAKWQNRWTLGPGLRTGLSTYLWADHYHTVQDANIEQDISQITPGAALELRWPFARKGALGGHTLIEPMVQFGWVGGERQANANEESTRSELDEGNLLTLSRFASADRRERGKTMAYGLRWMHEAPKGWSTALTLGQVWREEEDFDFTPSSGLSGTTSDLLIAGRFSHPIGVTLTARGLLDEDNGFSKAEARAGWSNDRMDLGASYLLLAADSSEDRPDSLSEWTFSGRYELTKFWETTTEARYDLADRRLDRVGLGLQYTNECIEVSIGASREFASSTNLEPSTDFDLTVALRGFGADGSGKEYRRTCRN